MQVVRICGDKVRLGITCPPNTKIMRAELLEDDELSRIKEAARDDLNPLRGTVYARGYELGGES